MQSYQLKAGTQSWGASREIVKYLISLELGAYGLEEILQSSRGGVCRDELGNRALGHCQSGSHSLVKAIQLTAIHIQPAPEISQHHTAAAEPPA